jgi:ubiquinone/menaquinone biosynthesis C-methylase UbiE
MNEKEFIRQDQEFYDSLEERKKAEIEHSDRRRQIVTGYEYFTDASKTDEDLNYVVDEEEYNEHFSNAKFYSITKSSFSYRDSLVYPNIKDCVTLDYCCGNGEIGLAMAIGGASKVHGIDISEVSIRNAKVLAAEAEVDKICDYEVMDAEKMTYPNDTFDLVHEYGALHHVDLEASLKEVSRVLKPDGTFVCTEALRHNPLIHWYRKRSMHLRTVWEVDHILGVHNIMQGKKYFNKVNVRYFHLCALAAIPFRKFFFFPAMLAVLDAIDTVVLKVPFIRRLAWVAVIEFSHPRKID